MGWISEVLSTERTEERVDWSKMLLGFWLMDGETLAKVGASPGDQLGAVCHMLKWKCP